MRILVLAIWCLPPVPPHGSFAELASSADGVSMWPSLVKAVSPADKRRAGASRRPPSSSDLRQAASDAFSFFPLGILGFRAGLVPVRVTLDSWQVKEHEMRDSFLTPNWRYGVSHVIPHPDLHEPISPTATFHLPRICASYLGRSLQAQRLDRFAALCALGLTRGLYDDMNGRYPSPLSQ